MMPSPARALDSASSSVSSSSSVRSAISASLAFSTVSGEDQYRDEAFDEESSSVVALPPTLPAVHVGGSGHIAEENREETRDYEDDVFEDDDPLQSSSDLIRRTVVEEDALEDYSGEQFEDEDERASERYGDGSFDDAHQVEPIGVSFETHNHLRAERETKELISMATKDGDVPIAVQIDEKQIPSEWYSDNIRSLLRGQNASSGRRFQTAASKPNREIPLDSFALLQQRIQSRLLQPSKPTLAGSSKRILQAPSSRRAGGSKVPRSYVEKMLNNARIHRLLSTSFDHMVPTNEDHHVSLRRSKNPLDTFCSVKQAHLEGKLATLRFESVQVQSYTQNASEGNDMSIATMQFVREMTAAQREILHVGNNGDESDTPLFRCMENRAPNLETTAAVTQRRLDESRMLIERANQLLSSKG